MLGQSMLLKTGKGEKDLFVLATAGKGKAAETCLPSQGGGVFVVCW